MRETTINVLEDVELSSPVFIEALPGIGHVGKLAADHIIDELDAVKFAELYSPSFPPQVLVDEDGIIEPIKNEFYYLKDAGEDGRDYIVLVGNTQGLHLRVSMRYAASYLTLLKGTVLRRYSPSGALQQDSPLRRQGFMVQPPAWSLQRSSGSMMLY